MAGRIHRQLERLLLRNNTSVITVRRAAAAGIKANTLQQMVRRGSLERLSHGVYRLPLSRLDDNDRIDAALHWPRCRGPLITHVSALALFGLTDLPDAVDVAVPWDFRTRRRVPSHISLWRMTVPPQERTRVRGIPCTTILRTFLDLEFESHSREWLAIMISMSVSEGLMSEHAAAQLRVELRIPPGGM